MKSLNTAIFSRLSSATALTNLLPGTASIYALQAPDSAVYPYVVYSLQSGIDENMTANRTKSMLYFIRGYSKVSNAQAGSIDAQIDTALHLVPFTGVSGWTNFWMAREQDIELVENPPTGGQVFTNGGVYRCRIDKD
jgi:hypothetical protein